MTERFPCPCCGFLTLTEKPPGTFDVCPVCGWEDDDLQAREPEFGGGANRVSLQEARAHFRACGASEPRLVAHVRTPLPDEIPRA